MPGYPLNYGESWGLFRAIDENLATLSRTPREVIRPQAGHRRLAGLLSSPGVAEPPDFCYDQAGLAGNPVGRASGGRRKIAAYPGGVGGC